MPALEAPVGGGARRRGAHEVRQPGEVLLGLQHQHPSPLVGEHVLAEQGAERSKPLVDGGEALPRNPVKPRSGPHEGRVEPLQHPRLLGREAEALALREQVVDAAEQGRVQEDRAAVPGQHRGDLALDRLERVAGMGAGEAEEHRRHPVEGAPGPLEGVDRVGERRRCRVAGDGRDLGAVLRQRPVEGRPEVVGGDPVERRQPERRHPGLEQRVGDHPLGAGPGLFRARQPFLPSRMSADAAGYPDLLRRILLDPEWMLRRLRETGMMAGSSTLSALAERFGFWNLEPAH